MTPGVLFFELSSDERTLHLTISASKKFTQLAKACLVQLTCQGTFKSANPEVWTGFEVASPMLTA